MKIHEYQSKALLKQFSIRVPDGGVAKTPPEAREIATSLGGRAVIKAQVHAGGRGKAGGVKIGGSPQEAEDLARSMIGSRLVTHQTTPEGVPVNSVLVERAVNTRKELYLSVVVDPVAAQPLIMASEAGGMEIEEIARTNPEKILTAHADPALGLRGYQARRLAYGLGLEQDQIKAASDLIVNLYRLFQAKDCSLAEINPLVVTEDGRVLALDAKLNFDDNAMFRHHDIAELRDTTQEDPLEVEAVSRGVNNYVKLGGNIGVIVNGAGLAMAAVDALALKGGRPANFLDIGTVNDPERVVQAFRIIASDPNVRAVMVNIFGGIARVDVVAAGVVRAARELDLNMPIVLRLAGTNADKAEAIIAESGLSLIRALSFEEAAAKAVSAVGGQN